MSTYESRYIYSSLGGASFTLFLLIAVGLSLSKDAINGSRRLGVTTMILSTICLLPSTILGSSSLLLMSEGMTSSELAAYAIALAFSVVQIVLHCCLELFL